MGICRKREGDGDQVGGRLVRRDPEKGGIAIERTV